MIVVTDAIYYPSNILIIDFVFDIFQEKPNNEFNFSHDVAPRGKQEACCISYLAAKKRENSITRLSK